MRADLERHAARMRERNQKQVLPRKPTQRERRQLARRRAYLLSSGKKELYCIERMQGVS